MSVIQLWVITDHELQSVKFTIELILFVLMPDITLKIQIIC